MKNISFSIKKLNVLLILVYGIIIMQIAIADHLKYDEIESNTLPVISLQYRGSWIIEQQDIDQAGIDFPSLYQDVDSYDDLRGSKLREINDERWLSYYTPVYPLACIPVKLFLQALNLPQSRTFPVTNAILVIVALCVVNKCLKVSDKQKLFALLLLILNPSIFYINYINYEIFVFAMAIISLTMYYNGHKKEVPCFCVPGLWQIWL